MTFSLKRYLLVLISLIVILMTLVLLIVTTMVYSSNYSKQAENYSKDIAVQTSTGISFALYDFDIKIDQLIDETVLRSIIQSATSDPGHPSSYKKLISEYFQPRSMDQYYVQTIDLYVKGSGETFSYGSKPSNLKDPFNSDYLKQALVYPMELNWIGYNRDQDCIDISRLIYDKESYEIQALLVIRLSVEFLLDKFNAFNTISIEQMYICDGNAMIMGAIDKTTLGTKVKYADLIQYQKPSTINYPNELVVFNRLEDVSAAFPYEKWSTIITINKDVLFSSQRQILNFLVPFAIIVLVFGLTAAMTIARKISKPIGLLVNAMGEVQQGNLNLSLNPDSRIREVNSFSLGFNEMVVKLDNLINTVYKIQLAEKESQLRSLRAQINPHFLFNTLQLISWKAHEYEAEVVCDMIYSLSYMLEAELYSNDAYTFTLREELKYIEHYTKIITAKYMDKIHVEIDVPDEFLDCKIPKLIIQPIIENAITHGLAPKSSAGRVSLRVRRVGDSLVADIEDDGIGIRQKILKSIQTQESSEADLNGNVSHGIALANIQQRIRLLYGEPYGVTVYSNLASGTKVSLLLPFQVVEEKSE